MKIKIDWHRFKKNIEDIGGKCFHANIICPHVFSAIKTEINRQIREKEKMR